MQVFFFTFYDKIFHLCSRSNELDEDDVTDNVL